MFSPSLYLVLDISQVYNISKKVYKNINNFNEAPRFENKFTVFIKKDVAIT